MRRDTNKGSDFPSETKGKNKTVPAQVKRKVSRISYVIYFLVIALIILLSSIYFRHEYKSFLRNAQANLSTIADLKSALFSRWLDERYDDANLILRSPTVRELVKDFINNSQDPQIREKMQDWLQMRQEIYNYEWIAVADTEGKIMASYPQEDAQLDKFHLQFVKKTVQTKTIVYADFHNCEILRNRPKGQIHLSFWIPGIDYSAANKPVKCIWIVMINPQEYLYPLIQTWPVLSKTGETLIVRREGNQVVFLNELRHKKDTALKLKLDIDKSHDVSATMAVTGKEGIIHGIDYRGEPVMSALRKVKNTPWFMVVEIDRSEVFKPFYSKILTFGIGILLLMLSATMAVVFIERNRDANWLSLHLALEREKSKLQEEYKAIAKEWETSFSSINEMIWILDKEMKVVRANRPLNPALELTPEELVGNQCWKIVHGTDEPVPECPYLLMRQSNKRATAEFKLDSKWIEVTIDPILDDNNELMGAVHIINDITERKTADEIIRKSQNLLQKIIDSAPFGAHTYQLTDDDKLIFIAANTSANLILGFDHSPLLGKELLEAFPGNAGTEIPDAYRMVARTGKSYDNELIEYHEGVINGAFEVHALQTGDNMMTAFFQDITQRKQAEEIVQRSHDVLEQLVKQRTKELENAIMELESFSYSVSHDLRAPLRGIDGWNHALVEDCEHLLDDTAKKYIEHIHLETRRMGQLIDDLLKLAHVSKREFTIEKVSLSTLAVSIMTRLRTEDKTRKADIKISPDIFAFGDRNLLETALTNLLDNAWKFTGKNEMTEIEFGTVQKENKRVFFVKDNGAGFDMQYKGKLFGAFQRLHNPTEFPGTGIGLATVQRIIHRHRGEIWAEAKPNQGATFYFTLEEQL